MVPIAVTVQAARDSAPHLGTNQIVASTFSHVLLVMQLVSVGDEEYMLFAVYRLVENR